ncbi:MAG TPA: serine hydrolase [Chitinophagaceae bacterium]|jgi:CubicO group peptidase (beta-lactamase class C family)|nr:serine hydrolase [Chitinophagaceae bacterium]
MRKMKRYLFVTLVLFSISGTCFCQDKTAEIDKMMDSAWRNGYFSGMITVAEKGRIIYNKGFGYADIEKKQKIDENTLFNLCSVTKQFTAMAIMMLKEEGKLGYDDELARFFPSLPYKGVTIRQMLSHISGLPDYMILAMEEWPEENNYGNKEAIELLARYQPPLFFIPGEKFQYSNTAYMLLASIVEKLSSKTFAGFLKEKIFVPLHMDRTFVCTKEENEAMKTNIAKGYVWDRQTLANTPAENSDQFSKQVRTIIYPIGDGGIFSTASDMMKWEQALKTEQLVKQSVLQEAYQSAKTNDGKEAGYGFGWFVVKDPANGKIVQHTGGWPGFRNAFVRYLDKDRVLLVLRNYEMEFRGIQPAVNNILEGKPYTMPQPSLAYAFAFVSLTSDDQIIPAVFKKLKGTSIINEEEINDVGYSLAKKGLKKHALEVMKANAELFPRSWNVYDSLGELYLANGDKENARLNYKRSLELNAGNEGAKKALENL